MTKPAKPQAALAKRFCKMFGCDTARILRFPQKLHLIIGWRRDTRDDPRQWTYDGYPIEFEYLDEKVIASGATKAELIASAEEYKRLKENR